MSTVSYDLDTSGGLMPLIRALVKPPDEETPAQKPKKHPYYKRPGKGHNHDCCDACNEGGDLICCDRCPASFHLGCYDPPLDINDIPAGLWLCKECRGSDAEKPTSSRSSRAQSPADADKKTRSLRKKTKGDVKEKEKEDDKTEKESSETSEKVENPMEVLVKAAKIMNPRQFELPREMQIPCPFPGTEKEGSKTGNATVITTDGSGCVPVPAKICHVCAATCKKAPLIQCDYCPLLFHQDCLDPPLTALPTGRWMCPNHVEQYIDWKLVNSVSATERLALWDKFAGPVDQHAIKVDFIRRARGNRPFRIKVPVAGRARLSVPDMVRQHYRAPPPLLPSRRDFRRAAHVLRQLKASGTYDESDEESDMREETKRKICLNLSCPQYSGEGPCPLDGEDSNDEETTHESVDMQEDGAGTSDEAMDTSDVNAEEPLETSDQPVTSTTQPAECSPNEQAQLSTGEGESSTTQSVADQPSNDKNESEDRKRKAPSESKPKPKLRLRETKAINQILKIAEEQLKDLDSKTIKVLAYQMMQQIAAGEQMRGGRHGSATGGCGGWGARAAAAIGPAERAALQRLGVALLPLPSALLPPAERRRIARLVYGPPSPTPAPAAPAPAAASAAAAAEDLADRLVRAAFCPVNMPPEGSGAGGATLGPAVAMRAASFRVGTHACCDLVLSRACRRVSETHALIFYDEVTRHYELINYSEWGTRVNGTLYACDVRPRASEPAEPSPALANRRLLRVNRRAERYSGCRCGAGGAAGGGGAGGAWEGEALLPHAALLQFGCQAFVFSLLDDLV